MLIVPRFPCDLQSEQHLAVPPARQGDKPSGSMESSDRVSLSSEAGGVLGSTPFRGDGLALQRLVLHRVSMDGVEHPSAITLKVSLG